MNEKKLIYEALTDINRRVQTIGKDRKNKEQGYSFRGIDDAYNELHQYFADAGVVILPRCIDSRREERTSRSGGTIISTISTYEFRFIASDGSEVSAILQGEGMDTGDKSLNKSFSGALKYALMSMFLIPTSDHKDSENETYEVAKLKIPQTAKFPIPDKAFNTLCDRLKANPEPVERGNLLAKTRAYYLPFTNEQEEIINQIIDN